MDPGSVGAGAAEVAWKQPFNKGCATLRGSYGETFPGCPVFTVVGQERFANESELVARRGQDVNTDADVGLTLDERSVNADRTDCRLTSGVDSKPVGLALSSASRAVAWVRSPPAVSRWSAEPADLLMSIR